MFDEKAEILYCFILYYVPCYQYYLAHFYLLSKSLLRLGNDLNFILILISRLLKCTLGTCHVQNF